MYFEPPIQSYRAQPLQITQQNSPLFQFNHAAANVPAELLYITFAEFQKISAFGLRLRNTKAKPVVVPLLRLINIEPSPAHMGMEQIHLGVGAHQTVFREAKPHFLMDTAATSL